ncbi:hypothetical protein [Liquorilactobacillus hordei]|uniref:hypothetical protein n=1 Tax=Liquorilactobacillus hordei TaxID=468911 RepID=UPI001CC0852E|nr:hypothetical protein [Liquorilactobacillus hordei]MBZ2406618.1 hypothetical protein [Liquorilactobacillus hordei]
MLNELTYFLKKLNTYVLRLKKYDYSSILIYCFISLLSTFPLIVFCFSSYLDFRDWIWGDTQHLTVYFSLISLFQLLLSSYCLYISNKYLLPKKTEQTKYYLVYPMIFGTASFAMAVINITVLQSQSSRFFRFICMLLVLSIIVALLLLLGKIKKSGLKQTSSFNLYFFLVLITSVFNYALFNVDTTNTNVPTISALMLTMAIFTLLFLKIGGKIKEHYKNKDEEKIDFILFTYSFAIFILGSIGVFSPQELNTIIQILSSLK